MNKNYLDMKTEILNDLIKSNEDLKMLESKVLSNSLLKICLIEKTKYLGFLFKNKKVIHSKQVFPNELLIMWLETILSQINQNYKSCLDKSTKLAEFGTTTYSSIYKLIQACSLCYEDLIALEKQDLEYFKKKTPSKQTVTLHKAEKMVQDNIYDLRILKEKTIESLNKECNEIPSQVQPNV